MFTADIPKDPKPPFDHKQGAKENNAIGSLVLIPSSKYPACVEADGGGREAFEGWAGKIVGYEDKRKKVKVQIQGDKGLEHLPVAGSAKFALANLVRL